jgi:SAM-dependent methyltransferase
MGLKVEIGCGCNKPEGYIGLDIVEIPGVTDIVHDLTVFPWPFEDNSVEDLICCHVFEHIDGPIRGKFMDEVWRILQTGGKITVTTPAPWTDRAIQDFSHLWPPVCAASYAYYSRDWREKNQLQHHVYNLRCNFNIDVNGMCSDTYVQDNHGKESMDSFAKHHVNVFSDMVATLIKIS